MDQLIHDLRYAARTLGKNPGFATLTVLILALGIGANTAVFSVVHAVLLKPLPFFGPDRLVLLWEDASRIGFPRGTPAPANYADWKTQSQTFEQIETVSGRTMNLTGAGEPERLNVDAITAGLFPMLGQQYDEGGSDVARQLFAQRRQDHAQLPSLDRILFLNTPRDRFHVGLGLLHRDPGLQAADHG
jgi:putative ABC transport system permease protein